MNRQRSHPQHDPRPGDAALRPATRRVLELVRHVDRNALNRPVVVDVEKCRQLANKRVTLRRTAACGIAIPLLVTGLWGATRSSQPNAREPHRVDANVSDKGLHAGGSESQRPAASNRLGRENRGSIAERIEVADREARVVEETLKLYWARQRLTALQTRLAELEAAPGALEQVRIQEQINLTAAITLDFANRLAGEAALPTLAATEYQRVERNFPGTRWALEAESARGAIH